MQKDVTAEITVTSFHASPVGGGVIIGRGDGGLLLRAILPVHVMLREPEAGEVWRVTGPERIHADYGVQIQALVAMPLLPQGKAIIRYLATNRRFAGIGWATANRLWDALGPGLYEAIKVYDYGSLASVVGHASAVQIVQGFGLLSGEIEAFQWLDRYGVCPRTASAAATLWGRGAIERISADPYELALLEPWRSVDEAALRLGVAPTDQRRLLAAVEEALARRYRRGHTAASRVQIEAQLRPLLGRQAASHAQFAVNLAIRTGRILDHEEVLQSRAAWFMEREIVRMLLARLARSPNRLPNAETDASMADTETREGYVLTDRQRQAVHMAVTSPLSVICGGAGTGKTTVVKSILDTLERRAATIPLCEREAWQFPQVALAGRAAKRITEATGREAMTVARFLRKLEGGLSLKRGLLIFDEASMLDLPSVYRILTAIPPEIDLLFIGDPAQLPPIGPGLPFQRFAESNAIPRVELDAIHRQDSTTGIPSVSVNIRNGQLPAIRHFDAEHALAPGVYLLATEAREEAAAVLQVFHAMAGQVPRTGETDKLHDLDIQILCPTAHGPAGSKVLNQQIERIYMSRQVPIHNWGLAVGSKLLWLKNDYHKSPVKDSDGQQIVDGLTGQPSYQGFMNGSLGVVRRPTDKGAWVEFDDGAADEIRARDLDTLTSGWAVSVHKAQGSAFRRVIVPVTNSRMLDRALIYTAVTRAIETVVIVGSLDLFRQAVTMEPAAWKRQDAMHIKLAQLMSAAD